MRIVLFVLLLLAMPAPPSLAQMVATNHDGSMVWMQSGWNLPDDPALTTGENFIYRLDSRDVTRLARSSSIFGAAVFRPWVSGDGRVVSWQASQGCRFCLLPGSNTVIEGLDPAKIRISRLWLSLSRNAQWAVTPGFSLQAATFPFEIQNVETGAKWSAGDNTVPKLNFPPGLTDIADDGTVIGVHDAALVRWRPGMAEPVAIVSGRLPGSWGLSADGLRAWLGYGDNERREELVWRDLANGRQHTVTPRRPDWVRISADGERMLFPSPDNLALLVYDPARGEPRRALDLPDGVRDAALTGDARAAIVLTGQNRLLRLDLETGQVETRLGALPDAVWQLNAGVPGSAMEFTGLRSSLEGADIQVEGQSFPVIESEGPRVVLQVPWDFDVKPRDTRSFPTNALVTVRRPSSHPFEARGWAAIYLMNVWPQMAYADPQRSRIVKAAHQDFASLVSPTDPARPGETVHLWLYGLGPLDRPVPTGQRGPASPPSRPLAGVACYLIGGPRTEGEPPQPAARGLRLPFVAYAPGLIGVYQVDAAIPEDWPPGTHDLRCEADGKLAQGFIPVR